MSDFHLDQRLVRQHFGNAAATYEQHDVLQREVQSALLERLDFYQQAAPERVVDLGAGTGRGTALLKKRYPKAEVIAMDLALPMLQVAKQHSSWRKPFQRVCAEATALPLPDHSVDVLHSNLCFQWVVDLSALFGECVRVLKPGGLLAFSSFGPDTLKELRAAWAEADQQPHVSRFLDMHDVGDAMLSAGLRDPVLDVQRYTLTYSEPRKLLDELRGLGATNADAARARAHRQGALPAHARGLRTDACGWPYPGHLGSGRRARVGAAFRAGAARRRRRGNCQHLGGQPARLASALKPRYRRYAHLTTIHSLRGGCAGSRLQRQHGTRTWQPTSSSSCSSSPSP